MRRFYENGIHKIVLLFFLGLFLLPSIFAYPIFEKTEIAPGTAGISFSAFDRFKCFNKTYGDFSISECYLRSSFFS